MIKIPKNKYEADLMARELKIKEHELLQLDDEHKTTTII